jgi:mono/diheme cytochrome c family protein
MSEESDIAERVASPLHASPSWLIAAGLGFTIVLTGMVIGWKVSEAVPAFEANDVRLEGGNAARGKSVFDAGDCASCHASPGQPDRLHLGGGLVLPSPFGTFRVPNISPERNDGIGAWSASDLANALIAGVSPQRQHYYPAFPYPSYTGISLDDVRDLYAYLKTLQPVAGKQPSHELPLIFRYRRGLAFWKILFFRQGESEATLNGDTLHDRGGYLVETLAHCADCHSTRNMLGAIKSSTRFAGGPDPEGTGFVPNITQGRIGNWSEADIVGMLQTGRTPQHGRVGSSMADVVTNTAQLPQGDREAIARYIKSLPPQPTPEP